MRIVIIMILLCLTTSFSLAFAGDCEYSRTIEKNVELKGVSKIFVEAGAGSLNIAGEPGVKHIQINAELCASDEEVLAKMDVLSEMGSGQARIETGFPTRSLFNDDYRAQINLSLTVPVNAVLDVEDSSGEASISNVAELKITDSSGSLDIKEIAGDLDVRDSSGALTIKEVGGDVQITDSSGGIYVTDIKQSLIVRADSSGEIEAKHIGKDVLIMRDSSGSIEVKDVGGNFTVERDGSGGIRYKNVVGQVSIPD